MMVQCVADRARAFQEDLSTLSFEACWDGGRGAGGRVTEAMLVQGPSTWPRQALQNGPIYFQPGGLLPSPQTL